MLYFLIVVEHFGVLPSTHHAVQLDTDKMPFHITPIMGDIKFNITLVNTCLEKGDKKDITSLYILNDSDSVNDMLQDFSTIMTRRPQDHIYDGSPPQVDESQLLMKSLPISFIKNRWQESVVYLESTLDEDRIDNFIEYGNISLWFTLPRLILRMFKMLHSHDVCPVVNLWKFQKRLYSLPMNSDLLGGCFSPWNCLEFSMNPNSSINKNHIKPGYSVIRYCYNEMSDNDHTNANLIFSQIRVDGHSEQGLKVPITNGLIVICDLTKFRYYEDITKLKAGQVINKMMLNCLNHNALIDNVVLQRDRCISCQK